MTRALGARQEGLPRQELTPALQVRCLPAHITAIERLRTHLARATLRAINRSDVVRLAVESYYEATFHGMSFDDLLDGQPMLPPPEAFPRRGEAPASEPGSSPANPAYYLECPVCKKSRPTEAPPAPGEDLTCRECWANGIKPCSGCGRNYFHGRENPEADDGRCEGCRHPRPKKRRAKKGQ